ncbi:MAG: exosome complex exonuclease Rrp41 [Candidatus Aenigmarchaeota archaeon]|nr:exosome complex exonuclease Rrp41 [Candidatus Aenigmarchaeota archaeon]
MGYEKRFDGRGVEELRQMEAKVGVVKNADGSAMFKIGKTTAIAAVYGPRDLYPKFLQNPQTGILRVDYNMLPFSGHGERVRPGGSRRSKEISMVMANALLPVLDLKEWPNAVVDVFVDLPQTDAGTRCAALCAASMALADAGLLMKDMVTAIAIGKVEDKIVVDLNYEEDSYEHGSDIAIAMLPGTGKITLLQMDGQITPEDLKEVFAKAETACKKILEVQKTALKEKFKKPEGIA